MNVTSGIILSRIRYSETSLIFHVFTLENGTQSYLFPGGTRANKKGSAIQPFQVITFKYYGKNELAKISTIEEVIAGKHNQDDPIRTCISIFVAEILKKTLQYQEPDPVLYQFVSSAIQIFDSTDKISYYPLWFLSSYMRYLGIHPNISLNNQNRFLDMKNGEFIAYKPTHPYFIDEEESQLIHHILGIKFDAFSALNWSNNTKNSILKHILAYYSVHIEDVKNLQSLDVLEVVLYH